jgi:hypothetical protein
MLLVAFLLVITNAVPPVLQSPFGLIERSSFAPASAVVEHSSNPAIGINHSFDSNTLFMHFSL